MQVQGGRALVFFFLVQGGERKRGCIAFGDSEETGGVISDSCLSDHT